MIDSSIKRCVALSLEKAHIIYWVMAVIAVVAMLQFPRIEIDTDPENMLPADNPQRVFHNQTKQEFGLYDAIVVGAVADSQTQATGLFTPNELTNIKSVTDYILTIDGVIGHEVMSLSEVDNITQQTLESGDKAIRFNWLMKQAPEQESQAQEVLKHVKNLPLLNETLAAENGNAVAIYVPIVDKNQSYAISQLIQDKINTLDSKAQWHITGLPVAEDQFGYEMFVQMGISAPLAGLAIFILLFLMFRSWSYITAAMVVAMFTVVVTMGLLIGMGFTVHIMSSMIAIFLMPIAVVDSVHIMSEFADRFKEGQDKREVAKDVVSELFTPMLFTSVTSTIGFLSLLLTPIPPVQIFGAFIGFGIILAFITTILFVPAYLSRLSDETLIALQKTHQAQLESKSGLNKLVSVIGRIANKRQVLHIILFVGVFAWSLVGIGKIEINDNPVRWFKESHPIRIADKALNNEFAGTYNAYLVMTDTTTRPDLKMLFTGDNMGSSIPESLKGWAAKQASRFDKVSGSEGEAEPSLSELTFAIEDQLFMVEDEDAIKWLENTLAKLEAVAKAEKRFVQPEVLGYMESLQNHMAQSGLVGKTNALTDVVKVVNRELKSGEAKDYELPTTANGVAQTLIQYQSSHRPNDLWHFVTPDYKKALIWTQLTSGDNQHMTAVIELVEQFVADNPLPQGIEVNWAGKAYINVIWQEQMVAGMLDSLLSAFVIVFIMMVLLFRSVVFGVLAMLPLSLTISFIYGLIGWIGKDYDMPIAVLSALTLGLSVDFAIHFLERARATFTKTQSIQQTMSIMFEEPANAITKNALVVALGFTPLLFAPLVPYVTVGVFLASIMVVSAMVTLIMLPALITILKGLVFGKTANANNSNSAN